MLPVFGSDALIPAVTVRRVRPASVPFSPLTLKLVQQRECSLQTGGRMFVVRLNKYSFYHLLFCFFWLVSDEMNNHFCNVHNTDKYINSCPASQTFSYRHRTCQLTCRSLSSEQSCTSDFLPVDGCSCADGFYLNEDSICVPMAKCSCYHNGVYVKPGKSINIKDEHWWVRPRYQLPKIIEWAWL